MNRRATCGLLTVFLCLVAVGLLANEFLGTNNSNKRIELESFSGTWQDIAQQSFRRHPERVATTLLFPKSSVESVPAAVLIHGSDGVSEHQMRYAKALANNGIAALVVDSFGSRHIENTIGHQSKVSAQSMVLDAFAALQFLAAHPRIDGEQIAIIGWSKGGLVADLTSREWYRRRIVEGEHQFAAHVAFYPWCGDQESNIRLTGAPLLYFVGERDDWSGLQACVDYANRAVDAGYDARIIVYQDALHAFDYEGSFRRYLPHALSWADCAYFSHEDGFIIAATGRFDTWSNLNRYLQLCAVPGAHIGTHAKARSQSMDTLLNFLGDVLQPRALSLSSR